MRRFALLLGFALSLLTTSAVAQNCAGFMDVPASSPFCPDVTWITQYGITKGCAPAQFCPDEDVTRLQMAAFMHRLGENAVFAQDGNAFGIRALLGTTDNYPLVMDVGGQRVMLLQPAIDSIYGFNPNVVNGMVFNSAEGVAGATIAGGGGCDTFAGGNSCTLASSNQVTGTFGTVGGGLGNTAGGGLAATVTGGENNVAAGAWSTVAGGANNTANGSSSFAAGNSAHATDDNSFVWGDGTQSAGSTGAHTFSVLATGGVGLYPGTAQVGISWGSGWSCTVNIGGNWACSSDRNLKENFRTLNLSDLLRRVVAMPVMSWTVIGRPERRHIGPVAQDFHASFGLGDENDDTHIDIADSQGVALAAIQGLNAKVDEQVTRLESALQEKSHQLEEHAATIGAQQREIAELSLRVQKAEILAADMVALKAALAELQRGRETIAVR